ncbi:HNH endonuclease signature motif containing protein [Pasteurella oralis]|uniref:HNH endonuclease signature motif containing protein n=1 Tax=Pasteurella oralis TaxID=1071947 RepID=A0ABW4NU54_9PAST
MRKGSRKIYQLDEVKQRFMDKVVKNPDSNCWEWVGSIHNNGYGRFNPFRRTMYAHRFSALLKYGFIRNDLDVCHRCDNRRCVNPDHLFIGTRKENMIDASKKGRTTKGRRFRAKLTIDEVIEIKKRVLKGDKSIDIANDFSVSPKAINQIINRKTWRDVYVS